MKTIKTEWICPDTFEIKCPYCKSILTYEDYTQLNNLIGGEKFNNIINCKDCKKSFRLILSEMNYN